MPNLDFRQQMIEIVEVFERMCLCHQTVSLTGPIGVKAGAICDYSDFSSDCTGLSSQLLRCKPVLVE